MGLAAGSLTPVPGPSGAEAGARKGGDDCHGSSSNSSCKAAVVALRSPWHVGPTLTSELEIRGKDPLFLVVLSARRQVARVTSILECCAILRWRLQVVLPERHAYTQSKPTSPPITTVVSSSIRTNCVPTAFLQVEVAAFGSETRDPSTAYRFQPFLNTVPTRSSWLLILSPVPPPPASALAVKDNAEFTRDPFGIPTTRCHRLLLLAPTKQTLDRYSDPSSPMSSATTAHDQAPSSPAASEGSSSRSSAPPSTPPMTTSLPIATTFMNFTSEDTINGVPSLAGVKRTAKNIRRVNTAERRATHNAVERARRETLNGRFLDLAALLPNLNTIRRPSKSAIVNSSIAHLNASRRHRILAAQTLRMIKEETDALRHEINQWRARAGVQGLEEPMRGDGFGLILTGELEFEQSDLLDGSEEGEEDGDGAYGSRPYSSGGEPSAEEYALQRAHAEMLAAQAHQAQLQHQDHLRAQQQAAFNGEPHTPPGYYSSPAVVHTRLDAAYENPSAGYYEPAVHPTSVDMEQQWAAVAYEKQQRILHHQQHHQPSW
ncbi:BHLH domain-containing protein [Mycena indigotica]|uniref:BHLH domain-containing protein n=1 Tax=Mycena indigotica TaxID=2126181 RepID=A0A8H6S4M0_9AGAR|nr:BHLH domain-containing protein [Mycena indigotica]KAF7291220.1 BHLH domain-containing protein [Mycena indigotica]